MGGSSVRLLKFALDCSRNLPRYPRVLRTDRGYPTSEATPVGLGTHGASDSPVRRLESLASHEENTIVSRRHGLWSSTHMSLYVNR